MAFSPLMSTHCVCTKRITYEKGFNSSLICLFAVLCLNCRNIVEQPWWVCLLTSSEKKRTKLREKSIVARIQGVKVLKE